MPSYVATTSRSTSRYRQVPAAEAEVAAVVTMIGAVVGAEVMEDGTEGVAGSARGAEACYHQAACKTKAAEMRDSFGL